MCDCMRFPDTVEEFMDQYKVVDKEGIYMSKGAELVPIFRMEQWFAHGKAQLSQEGTTKDATSDLINRQATIDALEKVARLFPYRVPGNRDTYDRYNEAWNDAIGRAEIEIEELPSAQPEEAVPVSWIEGQIKRLNSMDNYFAKLTADIIKTMLNEWSKRRTDD